MEDLRRAEGKALRGRAGPPGEVLGLHGDPGTADAFLRRLGDRHAALVGVIDEQPGRIAGHRPALRLADGNEGVEEIGGEERREFRLEIGDTASSGVLFLPFLRFYLLS